MKRDGWRSEPGAGAGRGAGADEEVAPRRPDDGRAGILGDHQPRAAARRRRPASGSSPSSQNGRP